MTRPPPSRLCEGDDWEESFSSRKCITKTVNPVETVEEERQEEDATTETQITVQEENPTAPNEVATEPMRRSQRENRGQAPDRYGPWTNK